MIRVTVSYPAAAGARFDADYYFSRHRALIATLLGPRGLVRCEMDAGLADGAGGPCPHVAVAHLVFDDVRAFQAAMAEVGAQLLADVPVYTDIGPVITIGEIRS
jgi:uncharacterized protein (TIGR02118 family)